MSEMKKIDIYKGANKKETLHSTLEIERIATSVKTTSAQRPIRVNEIGARLHRYRRWRGKPQRNRKLPS